MEVELNSAEPAPKWRAGKLLDGRMAGAFPKRERSDYLWFWDNYGSVVVDRLLANIN